MGKEIVIWIDGHGPDAQISVADAFCPHLGSHLGPEAGGCVTNGRLVCPFHGFEFDAARNLRRHAQRRAPALGQPQHLPDPRNQRPDLRLARTQRPPASSGPCPTTRSSKTAGASSTRARSASPAIPQETTENIADLAHLAYVHGYGGVNGDYPILVDAHQLIGRIDFQRTTTFGPLARVVYHPKVRVNIHGLGYSLVEVTEPDYGFRNRTWILATPVDGELIDFTIIVQTQILNRPKNRVLGMAFLPQTLRARIINKITIRVEENDVHQDIKVWSRKRYIARPRLCRSDGEIMTFRRYCQQFYPNEAEETAEPLRLLAD